MNLVALIYSEYLSESGRWVTIPELKEWEKVCPGAPRYESPALGAPERVGSRLADLIHSFNLRWKLRKPLLDVGADLHPEVIFIERVARCDVMPASKMPTFQLVDQSYLSPFGLRWIVENDERKSLRYVLDIVTGVDRMKRFFYEDEKANHEDVGAHCDTESLDFMRERLILARGVVGKMNEKSHARAIDSWCFGWLEFGKWFRNEFPTDAPPPRSESIDQIYEVLTADDRELFDRYDFSWDLKKKAVEP